MTGIYSRLPPDFYDASLRSANPVTRYYHGNRYAKIRRFVSQSYKPGMRMLDIGCGSASWNTDKLPLTGLDQNAGMAGYGREKGFIKDIIEWDLSKTPLPLVDGSYDVIVISEVLEHIKEPEGIIREAGRLLKKGGLLIITVPLDTPFSAWDLLFGLECVVLGDILGNGYYRSRCGHINHFSVDGICGLCEKSGFAITEKDVTLMNIGFAARKK
jgi:2-polyprenyl-3-methyl-5-hydroxy-6-metoxy-1,4-benzoquinol methylase